MNLRWDAERNCEACLDWVHHLFHRVLDTSQASEYDKRRAPRQVILETERGRRQRKTEKALPSFDPFIYYSFTGLSGCGKAPLQRSGVELIFM